MEFKHSPAPWFADIRGGCCAVYQKKRANDTAGCHRDDDRNIVYSSNGTRYDEKLFHWFMDEETQANFTLIAAAPELLEALIDCKKWVLCKELQGKADLAIKKALGE